MEFDSYMYMRKKYTFDERFFDHIDSEEKAYILGFLYADGYNDESRGVITLSLQEADKEILDKISVVIKNTKPLQLIDMKKYHKGKSHQNQYRLNLCSRHMSQLLSKLGCYQNKSCSCKFPSVVSDTLLRHFLRGYFDGDGCVSYTINKQRRPCGSVSFVGSKYFCHSFSDHLDTLEINSTVSYSKKYDKQIRRLAFGGRNQLIKFYDYIYKNATIYLARKKNKFDEFIMMSHTHLRENKPTNVYKNTIGSKLPFRVVKTMNYKSIHLGSFLTQNEAIRVSLKWDEDYGRTVTALN